MAKLLQSEAMQTNGERLSANMIMRSEAPVHGEAVVPSHRDLSTHSSIFLSKDHFIKANYTIPSKLCKVAMKILNRQQAYPSTQFPYIPNPSSDTQID